MILQESEFLGLSMIFFMGVSLCCFSVCRLRYVDGLHGNHNVVNLPCIGLVENVFGVVSVRTRAVSEEREVGSVGVNGVVHVAVLIGVCVSMRTV